jgi:hypothetical protein
LNRLSDQLHYMSSSGDKSQDTTRYWFDTRANLRREMEERKARFDDRNEVRGRIADTLKKLTAGATLFEGVHTFTPHADVPDDSALRLVVLPPEHFYSREEPRVAHEAVLEYVRSNGTKPRHRGNRLLFLAPDHGALSRLSDCVRVVLAWQSIVEDVGAMRLVLDNLQAEQAKKELKAAEEVLPRVGRECYKWLLCPSQDEPTKPVAVEAALLNTSGAALGPEIERVCLDNEWVIATWSPIHLRAKLKEIYWKPDKPYLKAEDFWADTLRYVYLPRLKDRGVLAQAIVKGAGTLDFFGTAYGEHDGKYDGFKFGESNVQFDDTLLLIEPEAAKCYEAAHPPKPSAPLIGEPIVGVTVVDTGVKPVATVVVKSKSRSFHGSATVAAATAKMRLVQIADEIVAPLASDPNAQVTVRIEIAASFPNGADDNTKRAVSENAGTLGLGTAEWE